MVKIGIVGCGTIGTGLARAVESGRIPAVLSGLNNRTRAKADALARTLSPSPPVLDLPDLVRASTLVVEAATRESLVEVVPMCLREGKDVFVISVGGLLDHPEWFREAEDRRRVRALGGGDRECAIGNQSPDGTPVDFFLHRDAGRIREN